MFSCVWMYSAMLETGTADTSTTTLSKHKNIEPSTSEKRLGGVVCSATNTSQTYGNILERKYFPRFTSKLSANSPVDGGFWLMLESAKR